MCVIGQPEPVGSVLTLPSGYDTLEYSWVKTTAVSVCLQILFVMLQNTNNDLQNQGEVKILQDRSCDNMADLFTKSLPATTFRKFVRRIGMRFLKDLKCSGGVRP